MAGAGAGAEVRAKAEIMDKGGAEKEPELKINNFSSATLLYILIPVLGTRVMIRVNASLHQ